MLHIRNMNGAREFYSDRKPASIVWDVTDSIRGISVLKCQELCGISRMERIQDESRQEFLWERIQKMESWKSVAVKL